MAKTIASFALILFTSSIAFGGNIVAKKEKSHAKHYHKQQREERSAQATQVWEEERASTPLFYEVRRAYPQRVVEVREPQKIHVRTWDGSYVQTGYVYGEADLSENGFNEDAKGSGLSLELGNLIQREDSHAVFGFFGGVSALNIATTRVRKFALLFGAGETVTSTQKITGITDLGIQGGLAADNFLLLVKIMAANASMTTRVQDDIEDPVNGNSGNTDLFKESNTGMGVGGELKYRTGNLVLGAGAKFYEFPNKFVADSKVRIIGLNVAYMF